MEIIQHLAVINNKNSRPMSQVVEVQKENKGNKEDKLVKQDKHHNQKGKQSGQRCQQQQKQQQKQRKGGDNTPPATAESADEYTACKTAMESKHCSNKKICCVSMQKFENL